jgi:H+/Cl- antiporter ClcA
VVWLGGIVGALHGFGIALHITEVILSNPATGSGFDWQFWMDIVLAIVGALAGVSLARRFANRNAKPS